MDYLRLLRPASRPAVRERPEFSFPVGRRLRNPKAIGQLSEAAVTYHLMRAGYELAKPLGDNSRYDLLIEDGDRFVRVQVKTGRIRRDGAVHLPTCSSQAHRGRGYATYRGQCELFAVYCPELDRTYLVPVAGTGRRGCSLRIRPTVNGQRVGVRWAPEYELRPAGERPLTPR